MRMFATPPAMRMDANIAWQWWAPLPSCTAVIVAAAFRCVWGWAAGRGRLGLHGRELQPVLCCRAGVIAAAALRCMGGTLLGRLWPRSDEEREKAEQAGYELTKVGGCVARLRLSGQAEQTRCELAQVGDAPASSSVAAC